jgi:hypothetical protein
VSLSIFSVENLIKRVITVGKDHDIIFFLADIEQYKAFTDVMELFFSLKEMIYKKYEIFFIESVQSVFPAIVKDIIRVLDCNTNVFKFQFGRFLSGSLPYSSEYIVDHYNIKPESKLF